MNIFSPEKDTAKWWREVDEMTGGLGWIAYPLGGGMARLRNYNTNETIDVEVGSYVGAHKINGEYILVTAQATKSTSAATFPNGSVVKFKPEASLQPAHIAPAPTLDSLSKAVAKEHEEWMRRQRLNTQSLPKIKVGEHVITCDPGIPEGSWVAVSQGTYNDWFAPDDDWGDMSPEISEPEKAPCRCPSLLKGHELHCEWHPSYGRLLTDEERERQRLENVWAIPKPREPLSYKTSSDCGMSHTLDGHFAGRAAEKIDHLGQAYGISPEKFKELIGASASALGGKK